MARPVWTPTDAQRRQAETMAAYGIPEADIARVLGVSKPTLRKHCGTELDTGATRANSKIADFLFYGICGGTGKPAFKDERARVTAAIFWMKTRGGWSETSTHKHTGAANGDPIEVEVVTVRERLTRRIARIAAARTTGGVPETRTVFAAAAFVVAGVATAQAADIAAKTGYAAKLDADSSALVYNTGAPDGFHVVVTTQQGLTDQAAVARFETVLATGQSATVSVPRGAGEAPARIVLSNAGDHLHIAKPNDAVSAR